MKYLESCRNRPAATFAAHTPRQTNLPDGKTVRAKPAIAQSPRTHRQPVGDLVRPVPERDPPCPNGTKRRKKACIDMVSVSQHILTSDNIGNFLKQTPVSYPIWHQTKANSRNFMKTDGNTHDEMPL